MKDAPEAKILVLATQDDPRYVREAFEVGASGYVPSKRRTPTSSRPCTSRTH